MSEAILRFQRRAFFTRAGGKAPDGISAEAAAVIALMPNATTAADDATIALVVDSLVATGTWALLDFFVLALSDEGNWLTDWKTGTAMTANGAPPFTANQGNLLAGTTASYIDTSHQPDGLGNYLVTGGVYGFMLHANPEYPTSNTVSTGMGAGSPGNISQVIRTHSDTTTGIVYSINGTGGGWTVAEGSPRTFEPGKIYSIKQLTTDDNYRFYEDGTQQDLTNTATANVLPAVSFELGRRGDANHPGPFTHRMAYLGGGDAFDPADMRTAMDLI